MTETTQTETLGFQTEVKQLLQLMIHSLYSNKEIFLRELVSNAADAADKLRFEALTQPALLEGDSELRVRVSFDPTAHTITIEDNGIGMSRAEAIAHLGTIAKSGTGDFLRQLSGDQKKDSQLIGQFGVGFYSAFIVADEVEVTSRRAGLPAGEGVRWTSRGEGDFEVATVDKPERGTRIVLHLKDGEHDFADGWRLRSILKKYSDHIGLPIQMPKEAKRAPPSSGRPSTAPAHSGPVRARRSATPNTPSSTSTWRTTTATRWRGATTRSKASWSTPRCCTCPGVRRSTCITAMPPRA